MSRPKRTFEEWASDFWSFVAVKEPDECWPWLGGRQKDGYGRYLVSNGKYRLAHQIAFALKNGGIDTTLEVMHSCDYPRCCNAAHLSQGTKIDNRLDCVRKNRHAKGETSGRSILTKEQVDSIRQHTGSTKYIASIFGVSQRHVQLIKRGERWTHE